MADRTVKAVSNADFARRVGIHYTMASRLRNGHRMPSSGLLSAIVEAFHVEGDELGVMHAALGGGPDTFGAWIRDCLYVEDPVDD